MGHTDPIQAQQEFEHIRRELALADAIESQLDDVILQATRTILILGQKPDSLKENQLRNVVNVAGSVKSIQALLNFIRYQIARESQRDRGWRTPGGVRDFGHQIIADIEGSVQEAAKRAANLTADQLGLGIEAQTALRERAYHLLAKQYLGYLNRAFTYGEKYNSGEGYKELEKRLSKQGVQGGTQ